jgi:ABC-type glycerol-3-phosphate transport system substrate-binding protein
MTEKTPTRPTRRSFLRLIALGGGSLALAACAPAAAPAPTEAPKPAGTAAPAAAVPPAPTGAPAAAASAAPVATQAPAKAGGKATLQFWQIWTGTLEEVLRGMVGDFNKSQNDITINVSTVPLAEVWQKLLAAIAAGAPPDIYTSSATIRPELAKEKAIEDLSKYGKRPDDMYSSFDAQTLFLGGWYGIPTNGGLWSMFYNEDLYKKVGLDPNQPPQTWDDIVAHGKKLSDPASNQFGIALPNKPIPWTTEIWYGFLLEAGGDFLTPDNSEAAFNSAAGVEALQFWVDLMNTHKVSLPSSLDSNGLRSAYQTGKTGMIPNYPVNTTQIASFSHKSRSVPAPKKAKQGTHFAGTYMPMMSGSKNKEAVWQFFDWWLKPENNAKWCAGTGGLPIRKAAADHQVYQDYLKAQPLAKAFLDSMPFAKPLPNIVGITEIEQAVCEAIEAAVYLKAKTKDALDAAAAKSNEVLKKNK